MGEAKPGERAQLLRDEAALNRLRPAGTADFDLYMRSMLHAIQVMGVDHVGMGGDWDGGGGVIGMEDITACADQRPAAARGTERAGYRQGHGRKPAARARSGPGGAARP